MLVRPECAVLTLCAGASPQGIPATCLREKMLQPIVMCRFVGGSVGLKVVDKASELLEFSGS